MTMNQLIDRLGKNAAAFTMEGNSAKAAACISVLELIRDKGYQEIRGKFEIAGNSEG